MEAQLEELSTRLNKARDSEDDTELPERQPNGHTYYSETQALPVKSVHGHHIHTAQSSTMFEEEKIDYSVNDSNVIKSDIYIGWKKKAERMQQLLDLEQEHNKELQVKIKEYETMAEAYRSLQADNSAWKEKVQTMTDTMTKFDKSHENRAVRRESIAALHHTIAKGVVYAEAEHEKIVSGYERQIRNLTADLNYITDGYEKYKAEMDEKIQNVEDSIRKEEAQRLQNKLEEQQREYDKFLVQGENERESLRQQLNQIQDQMKKGDELENENFKLTEELDQMRRNKQACMIAAAESINEYRYACI